MRKRKVVVLAVCLSIFTLMCGLLNVSAASYVENVIGEEFTSRSACKLLAPGDMDADGEVVADDLVVLKQLLLSDIKDTSYTAVYAAKGETAKYSDVNGDEFVNVKDLVRMKKNSAKNAEFVADGVMSLNGNSAFSGAFTSVLCADSVYEVSITYKADYPITVKMADLGEEIVFDAQAKAATVIKTFKTPEKLNDTDGIEFQITGIASVENIAVTRVGIDNDIVDNW